MEKLNLDIQGYVSICARVAMEEGLLSMWVIISQSIGQLRRLMNIAFSTQDLQEQFRSQILCS